MRQTTKSDRIQSKIDIIMNELLVSTFGSIIHMEMLFRTKKKTIKTNDMAKEYIL